MQMHPMVKGVIRGFSRFHQGLYRTFGGAGLLGKNTLILTTTGRKTGREISTPLLYVKEGEKLYLVASFGGNDTPPGWYSNLTKNPKVKAEVGSSSRAHVAKTLSTEEAALIWPKLLAIYPAYASYQRRTTRVIPIVELTPV